MARTNMVVFATGLNRFRDMANDRRKEIAKAAALRGLRDLIFGTRVDTGRARGNWQVSEVRPATGHDPDKMDRGGASVYGEGATKIMSMSGDEIIWMHNGVPYIGVLEDKDKMLAGATAALQTWVRSIP